MFLPAPGLTVVSPGVKDEDGMNMMKKHSLCQGGSWLCLSLLLALFILPRALFAAEDEDFSQESSLTQADIDAYVYLLPRLTPEVTFDPARANQLMINANISKRRLVYVGAKVAIAQAMAIGAVSPQQLTDNNVPLYLYPSPEEISLVNSNLASLTLAQETARRAAAGSEPFQPPAQ